MTGPGDCGGTTHWQQRADVVVIGADRPATDPAQAVNDAVDLEQRGHVRLKVRAGACC
jgi:hypothetical protein